MNTVDCHVTNIIGPTYCEYGKWWVPVAYNSWGRTSKTNIMCDSREEAQEIEVGFVFEA